MPSAYAPWAPLDLAAAPNLVTPWKLRALDADPAACLAVLRRGGVAAEALPDRDPGTRCERVGLVRLTRLGPVALAPVETRCGIAVRLALWARHDLEPAAQSLMGSPAVRIAHFSSYACRPMRTSRGLTSRWSEHATANAFDLAGVTLADGRQFSVARDWGTPFLARLHQGLCARFRLTLGPDYNALHADHFHVDQGWFPGCR